MSDVNCQGCTEGGYHTDDCNYFPKQRDIDAARQRDIKVLNQWADRFGLKISIEGCETGRFKSGNGLLTKSVPLHEITKYEWTCLNPLCNRKNEEAYVPTTKVVCEHCGTVFDAKAET